MRILITLILWSAVSLAAQSTLPREVQHIYPRSIGPASMSGRVTSIAVVDKNPNHIFIGTASGGLWKSTSGGISWESVFDSVEVASIGAVAVQQNNPDVVWAGTGEGNPRNSHNSGKGIYKSLDGGRTWKLMGLENSRTIHRIIINPTNGNEVYVAAMGSIWGPGSERGVFKSTDGGMTWNKVLYVNDLTGCAELVIDPVNPNKLFAAMWEYQRKPYTFNSGGKGSGIYLTVDGGKTWMRQGEKQGLPKGEIGRCGLAIAPSNPLKVYALVESEKQEMYISEDGGYQWNKVPAGGNMGNRPFYYSEIYVDPNNEHHIISLWSQVTHSIDGGKNWETLLDWGHIHPDHHAFYIHPGNPALMMDGNDGGFNISSDGGKTWRFAANLPVGQFYHVNVDDEIPYNVYGGLQDNGSWKGPGFSWTNGGIRNSDWKELLFGDGFDVVPLPGNHQKGYAAWQGGNAYFYDLATGSSQAIQPVHPEGKHLRFNWNAPFVLHPSNPNGLYFGSQYLHKSYNNGLSYTIISPDLSTNDSSKLHQAESGGLTIDATNAENYCTIIAIAPSKADTNVIWVGTDDGNLQLTTDGGKTWALQNQRMPGLPKNGWIPVIWTNPKAAAEAWIVVNNYRQNDWNPYLFKTTDMGKTWQKMVSASQVSGHVLAVHRDYKEPNLVWLGTDHGLYVSFDGGKGWTHWTQNIPSCPVQDFAYQQREDDLVIGTFGRSLYIFDDIEPFRLKAAGNKPVNDIEILHTGHGYLADFQRPDGERFGGDAFYEAPNKPHGAVVDFYLKGKTNKAGKWEKQKIRFEIWQNGEKLRSWERSYDSGGFYRTWWNMRRDGFRYPTHGKVKNEDLLPPGLAVTPGEYQIKLIFDKTADSNTIEVIQPQGQPFSAAGYAKRMELNKRLEGTVGRAFKAFEALKDAEDIITQVNSVRYADDSAAARLTKLSKPVRDSIEALKLLFMQAKNITYYEDYTVRLSDKLGAAAQYIGSNEIPGINAENAVANAETFTTEIVNKVNDFFSKQWNTYRIAAEKEELKLFKNLGDY